MKPVFQYSKFVIVATLVVCITLFLSQSKVFANAIEFGVSGVVSDSLDCDCVESIPQFTFGNHIVEENQEGFCVSFDASNFTDVQSFLTVFSWNPNVIYLDYFNNFDVLNFPISTNTVSNVDDGIMFMIYDGFGNLETLPDGTSLFELCFDVVGDAGDSTGLNLIGAFNVVSPEVEYGDQKCIHEYKNQSIGSVVINCPSLTADIDICYTEKNNGSIAIEPCGGTFPFSYKLDPIGETGNLQSDESALITNLAPGDYELSIIDGNGIEFTKNVTIEETEELALIDEIIVLPTCYDDNDGQLSVTASGGSNFLGFGYTYQWSNFQYSHDLLGLTSDDYTVTVTDIKGCTLEKTYDLKIPSITIDYDVTPVSDCAEEDGIISFSISGGNGEPYDVSVFPLAVFSGGSSYIMESLPPGSYTIEVKDSRDCPYEIDITMGLETPLCNTDPCLGDIEELDPSEPCNCKVTEVQVLGCMDSNYCEYNPLANCDDGTCLILVTSDPCGCSPVLDSDGDMICDALDCAPFDPIIYPGAEELCDLIDNNCNGEIDEGLEIFMYYYDADGDGFGQGLPTDITTTCSEEAPEGFADNFDDCDDSNPLINPNAVDIPNDGIDQNCDGEDFVSSTNDKEGERTITLTPNPAQDYFLIETGLDYNNVNIYNLQGMLVLHSDRKQSISVSNLNSGVYIVELVRSGLVLYSTRLVLVE